MAVAVKICGLKTPATVTAAVDGGAAMLGFNFYAKSPRYLTPSLAGELGKLVPAGIAKVDGILPRPAGFRTSESFRSAVEEVSHLLAIGMDAAA